MSHTSERLILLTVVLLLLQHVVSCIWVYIGRFDTGSKDNWIYQRGYYEMGDIDLYVTSFYFTVTTIMTVGYGDITAFSMTERLLCILLMLIGVIAFSFATGAISSIITNQDSVDAKLREKLGTLQNLKDDYEIDDKLYQTIVKALQYGHYQNRSKKTVG